MSDNRGARTVVCKCRESVGCEECEIHRRGITDPARLLIRRLLGTVPGNRLAAENEDVKVRQLIEWKESNRGQ